LESRRDLRCARRGPAARAGHSTRSSTEDQWQECKSAHDPSCPVEQNTVNAVPGNPFACGYATAIRSSITFRVPCTPGRIDCARPALAQRTSCRCTRQC
jgi:hypothetical protein